MIPIGGRNLPLFKIGVVDEGEKRRRLSRENTALLGQALNRFGTNRLVRGEREQERPIMVTYNSDLFTFSPHMHAFMHVDSLPLEGRRYKHPLRRECPENKTVAAAVPVRSLSGGSDKMEIWLSRSETQRSLLQISR